jgi:hypothetical protein
LTPPLSPDDADRLAEEHFMSHYQDCGGLFHPVRVAELPKYGKFYYQVRWAVSRKRTDDDSDGYIGDGGVFVSSTTGEVEQFGTGDVANAWAILRSRHALAAGVEPSIEALAEVLASYSPDELDELGRRSKSPLER